MDNQETQPTQPDVQETQATTPVMDGQARPVNATQFDNSFEHKMEMITPDDPNEVAPEDMDKETKALYDSLDTNNADSLNEFGTDLTDQNVALSIKTLDNVQNKDSGEIGKQLNELTVALKDLPDQKKKQNWLQRIIHKTKMSSYQLQAQYQSGAATITNIGKELKKNAAKLEKNNEDMEAVYKDRVKYYHQLGQYLTAGEAKLKDLNDHLIPDAVDKVKHAKTTQEKFDAEQKLSELKSYQNTLSQRVGNWQAAQTLAYQQVNQLNLIASSNKKLIGNINTTINTAIPVWYTEATNAIFLMAQKEANDANNAVVKATNDMIKQTAESTKTQAIDIVKGSQAPVIKTETLEESYTNLVTAIKDSQAILKSTNKVREESRKKLLEVNDKFHKELTDALNSDDSGMFKSISDDPTKDLK